MSELGRVLFSLTAIVRRQAVLLLLIAVSLAAYGGMVALHLVHGTLRGAFTPQFVGCYTLAFAAFVGLLLWVEKGGAVALPLAWAAAVLFRLVLLFTTPTLSDDVYRYLWDGRVANHGLSPYAYPVASPALDSLDLPLRTLVNHPDLASPYLPVAEALFRGLTWAFPLRPSTLQGAMVLLDLATALLLARLLAIAALPRRRILLYLWHPLVIVETAHGAHVDAWMLFLTVLAVWLALAPARNATPRQRWLPPWQPTLPAITLALATLTKPLPLLLVPVFLPRWRWRGLLLYGGMILLLLLPAGLAAGWGLVGPMDGSGLFGALRIYTRYWSFNSGVYHWLEAAFRQLGAVQPDAWARRLVALALLASLVVVWRLARRRTSSLSTLRLMAVPFMAFVLLTPTLHPWYLAVLLAFLPFVAPANSEAPVRWLHLAPWLYLSAAIALSYLTYLDPLNFQELAWVRAVEWWPTWALLLIDLRRTSQVRRK